MNPHDENPKLSRRAEVQDLVAKAAILGKRVDGYFGDSAYYGVASPVDLEGGARAIRFRWLGPAESHGEALFTPELQVVDSGASASNR
jgi:hypothetical protein